MDGRVAFSLLLLALPCWAAGEAEPLEVLKLRPNFYVIAGAGGNVGVQAGAEGVVLVDAGARESSGAVLSEVRRIAEQPIRYIIDTGPDADHAGGNAELSKAGVNVLAIGNNALGDMVRAMTGGGASILAYQNVLTRMSEPSGAAAAFAREALPNEVFFHDRKYIYFNHEGIEILHQAAAHTDADSVVFFRISDVVMAGEILDTTRFPVIDVKRGGSIEGEIKALNKLIELAIPPGPFAFEEGGTWVVPGHGRICDQADVVEYRDMIVIIRDVIQDMMKRGMTLDQIRRASPAGPYEKQYGSSTGLWTTNDFVEAVYKSLGGTK